MKKIIALLLASSFLITSCNLSFKPSEADIAAAIAETQQVEAVIKTGIALTMAAAVTNTPLSTNTPIPTETPVATNTPEATLTPTLTNTPYFSPTPTLNLQLTLETINKCDYPVDVKITGPMSWSITIPAHTKDSRQIARGSYHFWNSKGQDFDYDLRVAHWIWVFCPNGYYN